MLTPQHYTLLKKLEDMLRDGLLTATDHIEAGTFVCLTQETPLGLAYHQGPFDVMSADLMGSLKGLRVGERIGHIKVVAIYDIWPISWEKGVPPVQVFDN